MLLAMQALPYVYKLPDATYIHITMRQYGDIAPLSIEEREDWKQDMERLTFVESQQLSNHNVKREWIEGSVEINGVRYPKVPVYRTTYLDTTEYPEFSDDYFAIMWKWGAIMAEDPNISYHPPDSGENSSKLKINAPSPCMPNGTHGNGHKMCTWSYTPE